MAETKVTKNEIDLKTRQTGWDYVTFPGGTNLATKTVTFPTAFPVAPKVLITPTGYKTGGVPTAVSDFTGEYGGTGAVPLAVVTDISTTSFVVSIHSVSGNFGASYNGLVWTAEA